MILCTLTVQIVQTNTITHKHTLQVYYAYVDYSNTCYTKQPEMLCNIFQSCLLPRKANTQYRIMHCFHNGRCDVNLERNVVSLGPASQRMEEENWVPVASAEDHIPGILWTQHTHT